LYGGLLVSELVNSFILINDYAKEFIFWPSMVVHTCNPGYAEEIDKKISVQGQSQAKNKTKQKT
jgi:hypothetical protein